MQERGRKMPRFFVDYNGGDTITVTNPDAHHILHSLRMAVGEEITLTCRGTDYYCKIEGATSDEVVCRILSQEENKSEPTISLTLYQALPKGDKFETIIQKAVELGATRIVPVLSRRCISRPDEKSFAKKLDRYAKISLEAAKQSGRGATPEICPVMSWNEAVKDAVKSDIALICYENEGGKRFSEMTITGGQSVSLMIGSEGGFDEEEVTLAEKSGVTPIWLGNRILRCETAPLAAISIIMNISGNM